jgi:hypothetical protein
MSTILPAILQAFQESGTPVLKLVSAAFPALQGLQLDGMSVAHADLGSLSACGQLTRLTLLSRQLQQSEAESTSLSPLSAVSSLRQLSVVSTDTSIAAGLTQLTGLSLTCRHQRVAQCLGPVSGLTQIQHLELSSVEYTVAAEGLLSVLTSSKQLTSLILHYDILQAGFDALLTHAPQLISLACSGLFLKEDRSASPCSWQELVMMHQSSYAETLHASPQAA